MSMPGPGGPGGPGGPALPGGPCEQDMDQDVVPVQSGSGEAALEKRIIKA